MFSYVFMKILERSPRSYDRKMEKASRGRVVDMKRGAAAEVPDVERENWLPCSSGEARRSKGLI